MLIHKISEKEMNIRYFKIITSYKYIVISICSTLNINENTFLITGLAKTLKYWQRTWKKTQTVTLAGAGLCVVSFRKLMVKIYPYSPGYHLRPSNSCTRPLSYTYTTSGSKYTSVCVSVKGFNCSIAGLVNKVGSYINVHK